MVAAGHAVSARAGADVLRAGGNAVDAALAAVLASCAAEPLLTGLGAGGYALVVGFDAEPVLLDFFTAAPGLGTASSERRPPSLRPVTVDFGDTTQVFNVGAASVGAWGMPAGVAEACSRWGSVGLAELAAPAARLAHDGVELTVAQAYLFEILDGILTSTPEAARTFKPAGEVLRVGDTFAWPELGDALELLGREGAAPFYAGPVAERVVDWLAERGGQLTREDLARYVAVDREPVAVTFRRRTVLTNPPPSAGGMLIAGALRVLDGEGHPSARRLVEVMEAAQAARTKAFVAGLDEPGFAARFLASRLGSTTHVSVLDAEGRACAITSTNGEGCGVVIPGTGLHPNNIMGEEDLNPLGFGAFPPGRRMPSMMAPTVVTGADGVELVVGSAGSNRIRSAILQVVLGVVDGGRSVEEAVEAPRLHVEDGTVYAEPGVELAEIVASGRAVLPFRERNLFFGGVQAVQRDPATGGLTGAGDPRRGGASVAS